MQPSEFPLIRLVSQYKQVLLVKHANLSIRILPHLEIVLSSLLLLMLLALRSLPFVLHQPLLQVAPAPESLVFADELQLFVLRVVAQLAGC